MKLEDVMDAHKGTKSFFEGFWENPVAIEERIFYEFLMMKTFSNLQWPPSLMSDFWTEINTDFIALMGQDDFDEYGDLRNSRVTEYSPLYETLANTPCFKSGSTPSSPDEMLAIQKFCGAVFNYVESGYIPVTDAKKHLELAECCLGLVRMHFSLLIIDY